MTFYGLADYRLNECEIIEFYSSRKEADTALRAVLTDEPAWVGELGIVPIEFAFSVQ